MPRPIERSPSLMPSRLASRRKSDIYMLTWAAGQTLTTPRKMPATMPISLSSIARYTADAATISRARVKSIIFDCRLASAAEERDYSAPRAPAGAIDEARVELSGRRARRRRFSYWLSSGFQWTGSLLFLHAYISKIFLISTRWGLAHSHDAADLLTPRQASPHGHT